MMKLAVQPTKMPIPSNATPVVRATRITFINEAPATGGRRRFTQPRHASALEEDISVESALDAGPEPIEQLLIVCVPEGSSSQARERARALVARPERTETNRAITLEHSSDVLDWRPGLAIVQGGEDSRNDMISALVDFAFYEGNLRVLEQSVEAAEAQAQADVALAHRVRYRNRAHWERLTDCAESCSRARLTFARLEPQLLVASRTLPPPARSWMTRLLQKSDMESRLESLNDRLEALEELYEGATQRIADYRWYMGGHALEIGIIVLLLIECAMMGADIYVHNRARQDLQGRPPAADIRGG